MAYSLDVQTTLQTPEAFGALPVRSNGDDIVRLRDVATVELGPKNTDTIVSFNGKEGTFIGITPTPSANPLTTAEAVTKAIEQIRPTLPKGMTAEVVYDASNFISASIEEVFKTIGEAALIVVAVILLFLGSFRSVLIPLVTIPLSLVGVCFVLFALGYSINLLTLLAMVLAIGLVVDDAIVVLENIHRHIEEGRKPVDAAIVGMKEIFGPIVSMTITLAAVYAPIGFTKGLTGALFREFAFTLAGAVVISGIVAVTLSPMMSSKLLRPHGESRGFASVVDRIFTRLENWYGRRLSGSLDFRGVTLVIVAVMFATTAFMFTKTASELAPEEDQGAYLGLVKAPRYATAEYTQKFSTGFTRAPETIPEVHDTFLIVGADGSGDGFVGFKLKAWNERTKKAAATKQDIQNLLNENAGVQAFVFAPPSLPGSSGGLPVQYVMRTIGDSAQAYEVAEEIRKKAVASGRFIVVQNSMSYETPRARITVDRDRAATLGVQVSEIGTTLAALVGGAPIAKFDRDNRSYDVVSQVAQEHRLNPERLGEYYVRASSGTMVPLSALVKIETGAAPAAVEQFNQLNSATLSAMPLPTVTTAEALQTLRGIAAEVMPAGFYEDFAGQSRLEMQEGNSIADGVRAGAHRDLSGAGRAVRELPRSVHHHDVGAAVDVRRDCLPQSRRGDAEHLHPGRPDHPRRAHHQARHPDGRVRQRAEGDARPQPPAGDRRGSEGSPASDPDDDGCDGARRRPAALCQRGRGGRPLLDGPGDRLRHVDRHDLHAVRRADVLHLHRQGSGSCRSIRRCAST